jgi:DNA-binding CsgD family transcriptional regulator
MRLSHPIEFASINGEVWLGQNGTVTKLDSSNTEMVQFLVEYISTFYPSAYKALTREYEKSKPNKTFFDFLIVSRLIRCNFSALDDVADIDTELFAHFEYVNCPMRGECKLANVVCNPEFCNRLSEAEMRVCKLWFEGRSLDSIADELALSQHTIHNHIRNAYARLKVHSRAEFTKVAVLTNLFTTNRKILK